MMKRCPNLNRNSQRMVKFPFFNGRLLDFQGPKISFFLQGKGVDQVHDLFGTQKRRHRIFQTFGKLTENFWVGFWSDDLQVEVDVVFFVGRLPRGIRWESFGGEFPTKNRSDRISELRFGRMHPRNLYNIDSKYGHIYMAISV